MKSNKLSLSVIASLGLLAVICLGTCGDYPFARCSWYRSPSSTTKAQLYTKQAQKVQQRTIKKKKVVMLPQIYTNHIGKYRLSWRDDPSSTMIIGWTQEINTTNYTLYYDKKDYGTNTGTLNKPTYTLTSKDIIQRFHKGMKHYFVRLTNLKSDTRYFFVIAHEHGNSPRLWFQTAPSTPKPFTFVGGGDSRNNRKYRQQANTMVGKLRPLFVAFNGDYTNHSTDEEWIEWLDDWQLTISKDYRMTPIIPAVGNHEMSDAFYGYGGPGNVSKIFDTPKQEYYNLRIAGKLLSLYVLNSEISVVGDQKTWLKQTLSNHSRNHTNADLPLWKMAYYHKPLVPHAIGKPRQNIIYEHWVDLFQYYGVRLVMECDAHVVKITYPMVKSHAVDSDSGFIRNDAKGIVYMGEGTWGAPLYSVIKAKKWTRALGAFNQIKWIYVTPKNMIIRTVKYSQAKSLEEVDDNWPFIPPTGIDLWDHGAEKLEDIILLKNRSHQLPKLSITISPSTKKIIPAKSTTIINVKRLKGDAIKKIDFFINARYIGTDRTRPYIYVQKNQIDVHEIVVRVTDRHDYLQNLHLKNFVKD